MDQAPRVGLEPTGDVAEGLENKGLTADGQAAGPNTGPNRQPEPGFATGFAPVFPPDLAAVVDAWAGLPEPIRAGILALVNASKNSRQSTQHQRHDKST